MHNIRVIPCLLLYNKGLVKTVKFKNPKYVGDPINAVKIFNDKEVDELLFLDITASIENREPDLDFVNHIATECFMPFGYGGGIKNIKQISKLFERGAEKIIINTSALETPELITEAANKFGSQSIVVSIDAKKDLFGNYKVFTKRGQKKTKHDPKEWAKIVERYGAGEIFINSISNDGVMEGYDLDLIKRVSESVEIPVVACGGAGNIQHFKEAIDVGHASAVAAGSLFVFTGTHKAVLINYPKMEKLKELFNH